MNLYTLINSLLYRLAVFLLKDVFLERRKAASKSLDSLNEIHIVSISKDSDQWLIEEVKASLLSEVEAILETPPDA